MVKASEGRGGVGGEMQIKKKNGQRAKRRVGGMRNEQVWEEWAKHEHKV